MDSTDHDLLIRIDTKMDLAHESFLSHISLDASEFTIVKSGIAAAHKRMDWLVTGLVLTVLIFIASIGTLVMKHS